MQTNETKELFEKAMLAWRNGEQRAASVLIDQILKQDFLFQEAWEFLHLRFGEGKTFEAFQLDFTQKYYPNNLDFLEKKKTISDFKTKKPASLPKQPAAENNSVNKGAAQVRKAEAKPEFCPQCNHKIEGKSQFCTYCGTEIEKAATIKKNETHLRKKQIASQIKQAKKQIAPQIKQAKKQKKMWSLLQSIGIVLIAVGWGGGGMISMRWNETYPLYPIFIVVIGIGIIMLLPILPPILLLLLSWLYNGFLGGINLTQKKIQGTNWWIWIFLLGLIPIALWLVYLALMMLGGERAREAAENALPTKKRCLECRGWNDYQAIRCIHCGQLINAEAI